MRSKVLSCLVGAVLVCGAWLTGACGSNFVAGASEAGSGGAMPSGAGRNSGGTANGAGPTQYSDNGGSYSAEQGGSGKPAGGGSLDAGEAGAGETSAEEAGATGAGAGAGGTSGTSGASGDGVSDGGTSGDLVCAGGNTSWVGCQAPACGACTSAPELINHPLYFQNHPNCAAMTSCPGARTACGAACPPPTDADLCNGTTGQWRGCRGTGCYVCEELVTNYPKYFEHHPNCVKNGSCAGTGYATCNANCPAPVLGDM
ncbi:MAG: hypothetical protein ABJB12_18510 [Pseudomonadota bacterium]